MVAGKVEQTQPATAPCLSVAAAVLVIAVAGILPQPNQARQYKFRERKKLDGF